MRMGKLKYVAAGLALLLYVVCNCDIVYHPCFSSSMVSSAYFLVLCVVIIALD